MVVNAMKSDGGMVARTAVGAQHSAFSSDTVWMKTQNLETRRKRVSGGTTD